jgi:hypothetical protein
MASRDGTNAPPPDDKVRERGLDAQSDLDADADGAGYSVAPNPTDKTKESTKRAQTWVPVKGREVPFKRRRRLSGGTTVAGSAALEQRSITTVELPGPFFSASAFVYPFLYPSWVRWLGIAFMSILAGLVLYITLFVSWIVIGFQLFLSVFAIAAMAMVNLALMSYLVGCFVEVIEETASGEERLEQLVDMSWFEILPRFFRVVGAAATAIFIASVLCEPLRRWARLDTPILLMIEATVIFQIFPVLLLTNLVDNTVFPFWSIPQTLRRLATCAGYFGAFQLIVAPITVGTVLALVYLRQVHFIALLAGVGPAAATWLMYYGHWIGRLARQLADASD